MAVQCHASGQFRRTRCPIKTVSVERDRAHHPVALEVVSAPSAQWKTEQQSYFQTCFPARTRYELRPDGVIWVRRFVRVGPVTTGGKRAFLEQFYLENWTPFADGVPVQDVVWHDGAAPPRRFQPGVNLPDYPRWPLANAGFVEVGGTSPLALVWPAQTPTTFRRELNCLNWNQPNARGQMERGFALLPALHAQSVPPGTTFEMNLAFCPRFPNTPEARWLQSVQAVAAALPSWKRWPAALARATPDARKLVAPLV